MDRHLKQINIAKQRIERTFKIIQPTYSAPYGAKPKALGFGKAMFDKILWQ